VTRAQPGDSGSRSSLCTTAIGSAVFFYLACGTEYDRHTFLTSAEVEGLATPAEYVEVVRDGYRQRGEGAPALPRQTFRRENPDGKLTNYSTILPETGAMGGYTYSSGFSGPNAWFVTPLFDAESGEPLALIDGASMNPFKTGATGAVAVDALARADASTLAVIGSGARRRGASSTQRRPSAISSRSASSRRRPKPGDVRRGVRRPPRGVRWSPSTRARPPSRGADIVITATKAADPVFDGEDLEPGAHVTAMGQYTPGRRELDTTTIERSTYVPDLRDRVTQDAGSFLAALEAGVVDEDHVHAELGEVVAGTEPGRTGDDEITVFDSGGTGIETVAAAYMLYEKSARGRTRDGVPHRTRKRGADRSTPVGKSPATPATPPVSDRLGAARQPSSETNTGTAISDSSISLGHISSLASAATIQTIRGQRALEPRYGSSTPRLTRGLISRRSP